MERIIAYIRHTIISSKGGNNLMSEEIRLLKCAIEEYIRRMGGHILVEDNDVEIYLPIIIEEVPGGVQFKLKGRISGDYIVVTYCEATVEDEAHSIKPSDLVNWAHYVNERFSYACKSR
jgi:hypothetical protein